MANPGFRHFEMADDRGQQVVEVMSDPPGQLSDGFHLVGLPQLILNNSALHHFQFQPGIGCSQFPGALGQVEI